MDASLSVVLYTSQPNKFDFLNIYIDVLRSTMIKTVVGSVAAEEQDVVLLLVASTTNTASQSWSGVAAERDQPRQEGPSQAPVRCLP